MEKYWMAKLYLIDPVYKDGHVQSAPEGKCEMYNEFDRKVWEVPIKDVFYSERENIYDFKRHGRMISWYDKSRKMGEIHYENDVKHGSYLEYHINGKKRLEQEYNHGQIVGKSIRYYGDGSKQKQFEYSKGTKEYTGARKAWYANGQIEYEGDYEDGKKVGIWSEWDNTGVMHQGKYLRYSREGKWTVFDSKKHKLEEGNYKNGKKIGKWKYYNNDGSIEKTETFDSDYDKHFWRIQELLKDLGTPVTKKAYKIESKKTKYRKVEQLEERSFNKDGKILRFMILNQLKTLFKYDKNNKEIIKVTREQGGNMKCTLSFYNQDNLHLDSQLVFKISSTRHIPGDVMLTEIPLERYLQNNSYDTLLSCGSYTKFVYEYSDDHRYGIISRLPPEISAVQKVVKYKMRQWPVGSGDWKKIFQSLLYYNKESKLVADSENRSMYVYDDKGRLIKKNYNFMWHHKVQKLCFFPKYKSRTQEIAYIYNQNGDLIKEIHKRGNTVSKTVNVKTSMIK